MDRFVSHYTLRLDAKGGCRFRHRFAPCSHAMGTRASIVIRRLAGRRSMLVVTRFWRRSKTDRTLCTLSDEREQLAAALYGTSEVLKLDAEGRVSLTEPLKAHAGIADAVTFVGLGHKFQIWEPDRFRAELAEATEKVRALKQQLKLPDSGGGSARSTGMMAGSGSGSAAAGGLARHIPVLGRRAVEYSTCATAASISIRRSEPAAIAAPSSMPRAAA